MLDQLVEAIAAYPYLAVAVVFLLCGMGLPLPEEIVLLYAGYICYTEPDRAQLPLMMAWCAGGILAGDALPYVLGRVFGVRLLRLRWLRYMITKQRLASFDRWFRRRGDWVILIARFVPGLRVVAFFTGGTMNMSWRRFLFLDGLGIVLIVPALTGLGYHSATFIERVIATVQKVERGILWGVLGGVVVLGLWFWLWQRRRQLARPKRPTETFVQPQRPVLEPPECEPGAPPPPPAAIPPQPGAIPVAPTSDAAASAPPAESPADAQPSETQPPDARARPSPPPEPPPPAPPPAAGP
jgi:membrane protein DedA with SNARE-associated domain